MGIYTRERSQGGGVAPPRRQGREGMANELVAELLVVVLGHEPRHDSRNVHEFQCGARDNDPRVLDDVVQVQFSDQVDFTLCQK